MGWSDLAEGGANDGPMGGGAAAAKGYGRPRATYWW